MEPCIKGFAMRPTTLRLKAASETDARSRRIVHDRLHGEDLLLVTAPPLMTLWYPVEQQGRLVGTLRAILGGGDQAFLEFARESAQAVVESPALRVLMAGAGKLKSNIGPTLVRMAGFGFNFGTWRFEGDDLRDFRIVADGMKPMPADVQLNIQGFIEVVAGRFQHCKVHCESRRPTPDQIIYTAGAIDDTGVGPA